MIKNLVVVGVIFNFFVLVANNNILYANYNLNKTRMTYYQEYSKKFNIGWQIIAAIDQYERNVKKYQNNCPTEEEVISICINPQLWSGFNNPVKDDKSIITIRLFNGIGVDGDGDGLAERLDPEDKLSAILLYITQLGYREQDINESLQQYYQNVKTVEVINQISKIFLNYGTIDLSKRVFPIPRDYPIGLVNNYGHVRSYGGKRSHEGVDIFAKTGTPVVSSTYGIIEIIAWNDYGGYRIGIRNIYNTYEYYAHLDKFESNLKVGDFVKSGQIIGYVGSTGYGPEGTKGKFPPHLHFGVYKFDGKKEWSFNPYYNLRSWERVELNG